MPVGVVYLFEVVHVAEQEDEGTAGPAPASEGLVEDARVQDAGEEVALGERAELFGVSPVLIREPADERATRRVGHKTDCRCRGENLTRWHARRRHDCERIEP